MTTKTPEVAYTMTFDPEAWSWFLDAATNAANHRLFVQITPRNGEPFDAYLVGVDFDYEDEDGGGDAVQYRLADERYYEVGETLTIRAAAVHIY